MWRSRRQFSLPWRCTLMVQLASCLKGPAWPVRSRLMASATGPIQQQHTLVVPKHNTRVEITDESPIFFCPWGQHDLKWLPPASGSAPLMVYLPGLDGSGLGPYYQFPRLGKQFELKSFRFFRSDRLDFDRMSAAALAGIREFAQQQPGRELWLMGESFGGLLALNLALQLQEEGAITGLVLINPATSFPRTTFATYGKRLCQLPGPLFQTFAAMLGLLLLDVKTVKNIFSKRDEQGNPNWSAEVPAEDRPMLNAWFNGIMGSLQPLDADTLGFRIESLLEKGCKAVNPRLEELQVPTLVVCGSADLLLPSDSEADRLASELPNALVHKVQGAGHMATLDDRCDLSVLLKALQDKFPEKLARGVARSQP